MPAWHIRLKLCQVPPSGAVCGGAPTCDVSPHYLGPSPHFCYKRLDSTPIPAYVSRIHAIDLHNEILAQLPPIFEFWWAAQQ
jgi:hypothetical protein